MDGLAGWVLRCCGRTRIVAVAASRSELRRRGPGGCGDSGSARWQAMSVVTAVEDLRAMFAALAAYTPREEQHWRLAELPFERNGEYLGRHVVFVAGTFPRERLDSVCPGRWTVSFTILAERRDKTGILERVVV